jgi:uncharacterized protein YihD (DUF1040 family)
MKGYFSFRILDFCVAEMTNAKSLPTQETAAITIEKWVNEAIAKCVQLYEPWEPEILCENIQILDFNDDILGHKFKFELTQDYACTSSKDAQEHYQQLLQKSSLNESEKELILNDYAQKTECNTSETLPPHFHLIDYSKNKLKNTLDRLEDTIYERPLEEYKVYYDSLLKKHEDLVRQEIISLKRWRCKKCRSMTTSDYMEKIEGVKSALRELAPEMSLEYMLVNGSDDTACFGQYLICERKEWDSEKFISVLLLTAEWQWLLHEKEELEISQKEARLSNSSGNNNALANAFKDLLNNHLNMDTTASKVTFEGKTFRRDNVLVALMHYSFDKRIIDKIHLTNFISFIAPFIGLTDDKRADNIRRTCTNAEKELASYSCDLKSLTWGRVKTQNPCADEKEIHKLFEKWDGLYAAIDKAAQNSELFKKLIATNTKQTNTKKNKE